VQETTDLALDIGLVATLLEAPGKQHFTQHALFIRNLHGDGFFAWSK
jgi:hypothetical protein